MPRKRQDKNVLDINERVIAKADFRARAHSNPLNDAFFDIPADPSHFDLAALFPAVSAAAAAAAAATAAGTPASSALAADTAPFWLDVGCGYGGLLCEMAAKFPEVLMLGLEIRDRVAEFCQMKLDSLRKRGGEGGETAEGKDEVVSSSLSVGLPFGNLAFLRSNAMKYLPNYFEKRRLDKIFFCYPDPHFKKRKHRQRIISVELLAEYAYVVKPGGLIYSCTDVKDLHEWMHQCFLLHPLFEELPKEEVEKDPVALLVRDRTDEATKVEKKGGDKFLSVYRRLPDPPHAN